jgi:hypothetical protein
LILSFPCLIINDVSKVTKFHDKEGKDMVKYVGRAEITGYCLKYYVVGTPKRGYCIRIIEQSREKSCHYISGNLLETLQLAAKLKRNQVFPGNLREIMEDMQYSAVDK